ncbi:MAG: DUF3120 domain-containing protein [Phormidium sp. GEM2.Bin31]|nr:DUF3120 domain-containing protein [Phormidium sp. BM_Day4_Bin.17]TVR11915.1 MAG: DUF3120 domain-containing protein [Phormidium sp. GEM2.Bin31]UCJ14551.1 MAG: DUF3120 domain-containing protein [Phormidium sp. PBR-2020]
MFYYPFTNPTLYPQGASADKSQRPWWAIAGSSVWLIFAGSIFLVSVPVFVEAPLVRHAPWLSLLLTLGWLWSSVSLLNSPRFWIWGDLLLGFSGSWFAGSIYWGWFRWEPLWHLPIECLALPLPLWCIYRHRLLIGSWFAVGSLLGTVITDVYFYVVDLIPQWRQLMRVDEELAMPIFQTAIAKVQTPWGGICAVVLGGLLLLAGILPLCVHRPKPGQSLHRWAFSGAVLSTILVDSLFWFAALAA